MRGEANKVPLEERADGGGGIKGFTVKTEGRLRSSGEGKAAG